MPVSLKWTKVPNEAFPRSSQSITVINGKAYIFGGEINPREPVDNAVHSIDIKTGAYQRVDAKGDIPEPRVGHVAASIDGKIYVFGGRGGPNMTPLAESGAVFAFDPATSTWTKIEPEGADFPAPRSYHCATATPTSLIVHAGCGDASTGRLKDVWMFDPSSTTWTQLADAPGDPRGGTAICHVDGRIWRNGGFNGKTEVGGSIDYLTLDTSSPKAAAEGTWETVAFGQDTGLGRGDDATPQANTGGPGARSVHTLLPLTGKLVTIFGEGKPSPTGGHDSAGNFWPDIWAFDPTNCEWSEVKPEGRPAPEERGWFASDVAGDGVIIWGGLNGKNERLPDGWILSPA